MASKDDYDDILERRGCIDLQLGVHSGRQDVYECAAKEAVVNRQKQIILILKGDGNVRELWMIPWVWKTS